MGIFIVIKILKNITSMSIGPSSSLTSYLRENINHSFNQGTFQKQINHQASNTHKLELSLLKSLKQKLTKQEHENFKLEKRKQISAILEKKLLESENRRKEDRERKMQEMKQQRKERQGLYLERMTEMKKKEIQETQMKIKMVENKSLKPEYNRVWDTASLIQEPPSLKNLRGIKQSYDNLKKVMIYGRNTEGGRMKKTLSFTENRHLDIARQEMQKEKRMKTYLKKLSEKDPLVENRIQRSQSTSSVQKLPAVLPKQYSERSVLYEQGSAREKHTYRVEIKENIKQYLLKQKTLRMRTEKMEQKEI